MPQQRICAVSGKVFTIRDEDFHYYEKIGVPPPTLCPDERRAGVLSIVMNGTYTAETATNARSRSSQFTLPIDR